MPGRGGASGGGLETFIKTRDENMAKTKIRHLAILARNPKKGDDIAAITKKIAAFDIEEPKKRPADRPYAEFRGCDTEGNAFDLSEHGFERAETNAERDATQQKVKEKALV
jgi:hypothetical protein